MYVNVLLLPIGLITRLLYTGPTVPDLRVYPKYYPFKRRSIEVRRWWWGQWHWNTGEDAGAGEYVSRRLSSASRTCCKPSGLSLHSTNITEVFPGFPQRRAAVAVWHSDWSQVGTRSTKLSAHDTYRNVDCPAPATTSAMKCVRHHQMKTILFPAEA